MKPLRKLFNLLEFGTEIENVVVEKVQMDDVAEAIKATKSTGDLSVSKKYREWSESFGSV